LIFHEPIFASASPAYCNKDCGNHISNFEKNGRPMFQISNVKLHSVLQFLVCRVVEEFMLTCSSFVPHGKLPNTVTHSRNTQYLFFRPIMVERISPALSCDSPTAKLLSELSSQGMTVKQLRDALEEMEIDTYLFGLMPYSKSSLNRPC